MLTSNCAIVSYSINNILLRYTSGVSNVHILTGENAYLLLMEKLRWIREFERKVGMENLLRLQASECTVRSLRDDVSAAPFLAEKRLVIVEGMVRCSKEEARVLDGSIHPGVIVLFVDPKPDKRNPGIKELLVIAKENIKAFAILKPGAIAGWVDGYAREQGGSIHANARDLLIEWNGTDQGMIAGELEKLRLVAGEKSITKEMVEQFCMPTDEGIIWNISDFLYGGKRGEAILYAQRMLSCGADPYGLWSMLLSLLKNIVSVSSALHAGVKASDLASVLGMNPYVLRTMLGYCRRTSESDLLAVLRWAATEEVRVKSESVEMPALIDSFLLRMP